MNLITRLRSAWNAAFPVDFQSSRNSVFFLRGDDESEIYVTHEAAFMSAAVWACIDVVASSLASLLLKDPVIKELFLTNEFHISLNPKFEMTIKHIQQFVPAEEAAAESTNA